MSRVPILSFLPITSPHKAKSDTEINGQQLVLGSMEELGLRFCWERIGKY